MNIRKEFKSEYKTWKCLKSRCYSKTSPDYKDYGLRGIEVSKEWVNSFETFFKDMGRKPSPSHSIDRIDYNGNYCRENCRWATPKEQSNNRRSNIVICINGETKTATQWGEIYGIRCSIISKRIKRGWNPVEAVTTKSLIVKKGEPRRILRTIKRDSIDCTISVHEAL